MPFVADDAIGIVALSLTCFNGCVQGLSLLSKAKHYTKDVSFASLQIEIAQHSLQSWGRLAGLAEQPPRLLVSIDRAELVLKVLKQLQAITADLTVLDKRYGLKLKLTDEDWEQPTSSATQITTSGREQREFSVQAEKTISKSKAGPWKKLRWVTLDDRKIAKLLTQVDKLLDNLEKLSDPQVEHSRRKAQELYHRERILATSSPEVLEVLSAEQSIIRSKLVYASAARLKKTRLQLGLIDASDQADNESTINSSSSRVDDAEPSVSSQSFVTRPTRSMRLSKHLVSALGPIFDADERTMAKYDEQLVFIEWKCLPSIGSSAIESRVNQIAMLLSELGPVFNSLSCRGYIEDKSRDRFGYVFDVPDSWLGTPRQSLGPALSVPQSLRQMLGQNVPSLNQRLAIAKTVLETVLSLHTAGWLHKSLSSDNVLVAPKSPSAGHDADSEGFAVYIVGYVRARADRPGEMTEPLRSQGEGALYHHPSLTLPNGSYRKLFDVFSVGLMMIELALWETLSNILRQHRSKTEELAKGFDRTDSNLSAVTLINGKEKTKPEHVLDLLELRHDLLLQAAVKTGEGFPAKASTKSIFQDLEAAVGKSYVGVVKDLLFAVQAFENRQKEAETQAIDEHEFALDVELKSRDTVQDILGVV